MQHSSTRHRLHALVDRARTLDELLEAEPASEVSDEARHIMDRWRFAIGKGDRAAFARRLAWDGVDEDDVGRRLTTALSSPDVDLDADWVRVIDTWIDDVVEAPSGAPDGPAFADLLSPLVDRAWDAVTEAVRIDDVMTDDVAEQARHQLLSQLSRVSQGALVAAFDASRGDDVGDPSSREWYDAFVAEIGRGLTEFLTEHAMLARQLGRVVVTWTGATIELLQRIDADREELATAFGDGTAAGRLVRLDGALSDRHHGGRRVAIVEFESGLRAVYKPRPLELAVGVHRLVEWLNDHGLVESLPTLRYVTRDAYGWVSVVDHEPARADAGAARFYTQVGELACIAQLLNGVDLHMDNVIATADGPVLIDVELFLQPVRREGVSEEEAAAMRANVLDSGLVTFPQIDPRGHAYEIGGVTGVGGHLAAREAPKLVDVNTDAMRIEARDTFALPEKNTVLVGGEPALPMDYRDEVVAGYRSAYACVLRHREALVADGGEIASFRGRWARFLLRDSNYYGHLFGALIGPRFQTRGTSAGVLVDSLNRAYARHADRPPFWPFAARERSDLEGLDIPYFRVRTDGRALSALGGDTVEDFFTASGFEMVVDRLEAMSDTDLADQCDRLEAVLTSTPRGLLASIKRENPFVRVGTYLTKLGVDRFRRAEATLAARADRETVEEALSDYYLYEGWLGTAVSWAAFVRLTGDGEVRRVIDDALARALRAVERARATNDEIPLGAANGIGGIVYGATTIASLLRSTEPLDLARAATALVTDDRIAADDRIDVEGGAAGAVLGLLALDEVDGEARDRLVASVDHLVATARRIDLDGDRAGVEWVGADGEAHTGFAHGIAGVALAVAHAATVLDRSDLRQLARHAYDTVWSRFDERLRTWPVIAEIDGQRRAIPMNAWCHGAPGVAVAHALADDWLAGPELRANRLRAFDVTATARPAHVQHLCCGNVGRAAVLHLGARTLEEPRYRLAAADCAMHAVRRLIDEGPAVLRHETPRHRESVGLFRGAAGIAYEMLSQASSESLPAIVGFEPSWTRWG